MSKNQSRTKRLTVTALLAALVIIVSFLPLRTLGFEINFSMVPIAIGSILFGPLTGAVLGAVFGVVSFIQCFGFSPLGVLLLSENALFTLIVCIPTRILAGMLPGLVSKGLTKLGNVGRALSCPLASLLAPLLNTVFFMSALVLLFYNGDTLQGFVQQSGAANPFLFVIWFVGINGLVEILAGFIVAYPATKAIAKYFKL